ncbi:MAG: cell wall hydrolase [Qipengyuania sp.]
MRNPLFHKRVGAITALALALTVPAVAQPGEWGAISDFALGRGGEERLPAPMPFETAGQSFPGSAFFYVEDIQPLDYDAKEWRGTEPGTETLTFAPDHEPGTAARAFQAAGSGLDKARALQCLSMAVYYEAASESYDGQRAVAQVVLNRVAHPAYPASVCGVVFQGSERSTGCQFTFTCDGSLARKPSRRGWATAQSVALVALAGEVFEPVGWATHYHTNYVHPYWASGLDYLGDIGAHRFYRWKGRAGRADAFSIAYRGGEPLAAPKQRAAPAILAGRDRPGLSRTSLASVSLDPPPSGRVHLASGPAEPGAKPPAPPPPSDNLPGAGSVKPEYARSGQWIRKPGG